MNASTIVAGIVGILTIVVVLGLILALPVMWLWNGCLVGAIVGVNEITWLQAWGLMILTSILFKSNISKKD